MLIFIQKKDGLLFLEWPNNLGEFAFKAMQDIIQILESRNNQWDNSHLKLQDKSNTELLR